MGTKGYHFLRRRRLSYKRGVRIIGHAIASNPKSTAIILVSICALFFATSLTTDGHHLPYSIYGSHVGRALTNSTTKPDAAIVEGVHSCENYVRLNQVGIIVGFAILWIIVLLYFFIGLAIICDDFCIFIGENIQLCPFRGCGWCYVYGCRLIGARAFYISDGYFYFTNNVGIGTIVGSAVFNILVIIALAAAMSKEDLLIDWRPFHGTAFIQCRWCYFCFVLYGSFTWLHSLVLVLFYGYTFYSWSLTRDC